MENEIAVKQSSVLFIPHGGGPLPLFGDKGHQDMVEFLKEITPKLGKPSAILVISAHWEEDVVTITSGKNPPLFYDYYGFPDEAYKIKYSAPGDPVLAGEIYTLLQKSGIEARLDNQRGFDHGLFVPLTIMYPEAVIPCVQLSLVNNLDPETHLKIGRALTKLQKENILILGSGFSFHNTGAFMSQTGAGPDKRNIEFQDWLIETCTNPDLSANERLISWEEAPYARYCHPREEHLLPLHVCCGITDSPGRLVFDKEILGKKGCAFLW